MDPITVQTALLPPILDERQKRIRRRLALVSPGSVDLFLDACSFMQMKVHFESTTHMVAHSLREIESSLRQVSLPDTYVAPAPCAKCGEVHNAHAAEIKAVLDSYGLSKEHRVRTLWKNVKRLQRKAHRDNLSNTRPVDDEFLIYWDTVQEWLDLLLDLYESHFETHVKKVDGLLALKSPNSTSIDTLKRRIPNTVATLHYFFSKLENPLWLPLLEKEKYFVAPRKSYFDEHGGYDPIWSAAIYLNKIVGMEDQKPRIASIVLKVETKNQGVQNQLIETAATLLPNHAHDFTLKFVAWLRQTPQWYRADLFMVFVEKLLQLNLTNDALAICKELFAVLPDPRSAQKKEDKYFSPEPISRIDDHEYEIFLKKLGPTLAEKGGIKVVELLVHLLDKEIELSGRNRKKTGDEDYLEMWRPHVEAEGRKYRHGRINLLVTMIRDMLEKQLELDPTLSDRVLALLRSQRWRVFQRISFHLLRTRSDIFQKELGTALANKAQWNKYRGVHEYRRLLEEGFGLLGKTDQALILSWIDGGPSEKEMSYRLSMQTDPNEPGLKERIIRSWRYHVLHPISKELNEPYMSQYAEFKKEFGEIKNEDRFQESGGTWVGPTSDKNADELNAMSEDDVIEYISSWKPDPQKVLGSSADGLGKELSLAMKKGIADRFSPNLEKFKSLHPTYVRSVIQGYRDALKEGQKITWELILPFCVWIVGNKTTDVESLGLRPYSSDPDWSWARSTVLDFIEDAIKSDKQKELFGYRAFVWQVIEILTHDPNPESKDESEQAKHDLDYYGIAINSIRSKAIGLVCEYAIWVNESEKKEGETITPMNRVPEVKTVLEYHLDSKNDSSLAVHSVYGFRLVTLRWLDPAWFETIRPVIFPTDEKAFFAAWDAYVSFSNPDKISAMGLDAEFRKAITSLQVDGEDKNRYTHHMQDMTMQHLMLYMLYGEIKYSDRSGTVRLFFDTATPKFRGAAMERIGFFLKDLAGKPKPEMIERVKDLLDERLAVARNTKGSKVQFSEELEGFGAWFVFGDFDNEWLLKKLETILFLTEKIDNDHMVVEKLADLAAGNIDRVIVCALQLVAGADKQWQIEGWRNELEKIIDLGLKSPKEDVQTKSTELISRLSARGYTNFHKN